MKPVLASVPRDRLTACPTKSPSDQALVAIRRCFEVEILRLQRDTAAARGELDQANAKAKQIESSIQEAEGRIEEVQLSARNQWQAELSEASASLNSLEKRRWLSGSS